LGDKVWATGWANDVIGRLSRDSYPAGLVRALVSAVATACRDQIPAILLDPSQNFADFHRRAIR
jgi:hypothetical protein